MDIHTTSDVSEAPPSSWRDSSTFKSMEALRPWLQWAIVIVVALGGIYLATRDSTAQQNAKLADLERRATQIETTIVTRGAARDQQLEKLENKMVTLQLFEERTRNIDKRLEDIQKSQQDILDRLPLRNP